MRASLHLAVAIVAVAAGASAARADDARSEAAGLRFTVAKDWTRVPAASDMRAAQFRVPHAPGDADDGEVVLFFFGRGQGGDADANLARWYGQMEQPDGRPTRDAAVTTIRTIHGLRVTSTDVSGTYGGGMAGGPPKPGMRLLAAVVEGDGGPWFWKAVGPEATMAAAKPAFDALLGSLEAHR